MYAAENAQAGDNGYMVTLAHMPTFYSYAGDPTFTFSNDLQITIPNNEFVIPDLSINIRSHLRLFGNLVETASGGLQSVIERSRRNSMRKLKVPRAANEIQELSRDNMEHCVISVAIDPRNRSALCINEMRLLHWL
jgi:hypothetical protein